jgi:hypothetical protein
VAMDAVSLDHRLGLGEAPVLSRPSRTQWRRATRNHSSHGSENDKEGQSVPFHASLNARFSLPRK